MLKKCEKELNVRLDPPLTTNQLLTFVGWLLDRQVGADTINTYLAGLRQLYISRNLNPNSIRSDLVTQIIKGRRHQTLTECSAGQQKDRLPVTPAILKLLKLDIATSDMNQKDKLLIWTVCCIAFHGAFRIGELLAKNQLSFNPIDTLLGNDIELKTSRIESREVKFIQLRLKQEKTNSSKSVTMVDVYEAPGPICPVRALEKWQAASNLTDKHLPAFRKTDGRAFTGRELNTYLSDFSGRNFPSSTGKISGHSFRIGLASTLGELGHSDEDLQSAGRWSSRAFEAYLKLPRTRRANIAKQIGKMSTQ